MGYDEPSVVIVAGERPMDPPMHADSSRQCLWVAIIALAVTGQANGQPRPLTPIERIVIIYQENRSFDHYFGTFPGVDGILTPEGQVKPQLVGLQRDASGTPYNVTTNPMPGFDIIPQGLPNQPFAMNAYYPSTEQTADPTHNFTAMRNQAGWTAAGPQLGPFPMDRFVSGGNRGPLVLGYYAEADIPQYWDLALEWTLADNFFPAAWGPSVLNYSYLISGRGMRTSDGRIDQVTGGGRPAQVHRNIGDLMNDAGVTWAWYVGPGDEDIDTFDGGPFRYFANAQTDPTYQLEHFRKFSRFLTDMNSATLPAVSFVQTWCFSEHAGFGSCNEPVFSSVDFVAEFIAQLQKSSAWASLAILLTYDEGGGFWDHVSPPQYIDVIDGNSYDGTTHPDGQFYPVIGNGVRVPLIVVSPFAKQGQVAHGQYNTCSITRFIEDNWGLGRLDADTGDVTRDSQVATLNAFGDIFDFPGDFNGDGQINLDDYLTFSDCLAGPDVNAPPPPCTPADFSKIDTDVDGDVDLKNFAAFQSQFFVTP